MKEVTTNDTEIKEIKKRGRKPKESNAEFTNTIENNTGNNGPFNGGGWSAGVDQTNIKLAYMHVELETVEDTLGVSASNKDLLRDYIASNAPDAKSKTEEIEALGEDQVFDKGTTIFPKGIFRKEGNKFHDVIFHTEDRSKPIDSEGCIKEPFFWNYQLRGMFKDACGLLSRADYGESTKIKAYKKVIDGGIMVFPRRVAIELPETFMDENGDIHEINADKLPIIQRPIRISGASGERVAIAASEMIPAGSRIRFTIGYSDKTKRNAIIEWLNYGSIHGLGAWRNSGMGIYRWREIKEDYTSYETIDE